MVTEYELRLARRLKAFEAKYPDVAEIVATWTRAALGARDVPPDGLRRMVYDSCYAERVRAVTGWPSEGDFLRGKSAKSSS